MTTKTITCVVEDINPYAPNNPAPGGPFDPKDIYDLVNLTPAILPAGNAITEIEVRRTTPLINPANFIIGIIFPVGEFNCFTQFSAADINTYGYASSVTTVISPGQHFAVNADTHIQIWAPGAQTTIYGKLYIVIKYKPISIGEHHY